VSGPRTRPRSGPRTWPRTAVVTGASRGLGEELATLLAQSGTRLILTARGGDALDSVADRLRRDGGDVAAVPGDVADAGHRARVADAVRDGFDGRLDLLVHNASALGPSPLPHLLDVEPEVLERLFRVNVAAPLALSRALRSSLEAGDGRLVHVSSDAAHGGWPGWGPYGMTKLAFELAARTLAEEAPALAPVIVDPGDLRTAMHQAAFPGEDISDRPLPEVTRPFWHWLLAQDPAAVRGRRFAAQGEAWELADVEGVA
jgi:NAD(P)-dependent dehydrogenase (short-subunit alcohol dehydrogenase family)